MGKKQNDLKGVAEETENEGSDPKHNGGPSKDEIDRLIREHSEKHDGFEREAAALAARKKKANQQFKAETGMTIADFMAARRLAQMEDEGEQRQKCDNLKICFNALSTGMQFDWIDAVEAENKDGIHTAGPAS